VRAKCEYDSTHSQRPPRGARRRRCRGNQESKPQQGRRPIVQPQIVTTPSCGQSGRQHYDAYDEIARIWKRRAQRSGAQQQFTSANPADNVRNERRKWRHSRHFAGRFNVRSFSYASHRTTLYFVESQPQCHKSISRKWLRAISNYSHHGHHDNDQRRHTGLNGATRKSHAFIGSFVFVHHFIGRQHDKRRN